MVTPGKTTARAPSQTPFSMTIGAVVGDPSVEWGPLVKNMTSWPTATWSPMVIESSRSNTEPALKPQCAPTRNRCSMLPAPINFGRPKNSEDGPISRPMARMARVRSRPATKGGTAPNASSSASKRGCNLLWAFPASRRSWFGLLRTACALHGGRRKLIESNLRVYRPSTPALSRAKLREIAAGTASTKAAFQALGSPRFDVAAPLGEVFG
jgi:hypothetical protein